MTYRRLGRTALKVGPLAIGTANFGWLTPKEESFWILNSALASGLNFIDTSDNYNAGKTEMVLGDYFSKERRRQDVVLATPGFSAHASIN